jgi:hypothetical protein
VNFTALERRLRSTCRTRWGSAAQEPDVGVGLEGHLDVLLADEGSTVATQARTRGKGSTGSSVKA